MLIWNDVDAVPTDWPASVVTIGVFDGVHRGHRELIRHAVSRAAVLGVPSVVLTFWPNPAEILRAGDPPARLATLEQRLALIAELGVDATLVLPFSAELSQATPEQFAGRILSDCLGAAEVVVGENFRFGHRARGDVRLLEQIGQTLSFNVIPLNLLTTDAAGDPVSSTMIRQLVAEGDVAAAARALARPHRVEGTVVSGDGRGATLGFPTANLSMTPFPAVPADGVYAGRIVVDPYGEAEVHSAAISIGTNPTFEDVVDHRVEAWAYDGGELDLYDRPLAIDFAARVRDQVKFRSEDELAAAVAADAVAIRQILGE
ncbi:MAG TPA: bifunctional riboflavin kinase/FAD synthetase [Actinobacteria bacterium]|nr:bifunctional riboflavin kinase/FAD synthetase [Actinomycetota bacterium]